MSDKEYKILEVQKRNEWTGNHGTFQDYALKLDGADGWVALTQKPETPAPEIGNAIYGHTETQTHGDKTFLKFKKAQRPDGGGHGRQADPGDNAYIIQMLEELTGRRTKPDNLPTDAEADQPVTGEDFNLEEIPF